MVTTLWLEWRNQELEGLGNSFSCFSLLDGCKSAKYILWSNELVVIHHGRIHKESPWTTAEKNQKSKFIWKKNPWDLSNIYYHASQRRQLSTQIRQFMDIFKYIARKSGRDLLIYSLATTSRAIETNL